MQNIALVGVFGSTEFINKNEMRSLPIKKSIVQITFRKQMCRLTGCGLFVKLTSFKVQKLLYFGHLIRRADSLEKTLMLVKPKGRRRRGATEHEVVGWHHRLKGHEFEQALGDGEGQRGLACRRVRHELVTEQQQRFKFVIFQLHSSGMAVLGPSGFGVSPLPWTCTSCSISLFFFFFFSMEG